MAARPRCSPPCARAVVGCGGSDDDSGGSPASGTQGGSINVAIVDNPQMKDIATLTPKLFTEPTGIKVDTRCSTRARCGRSTTRDVAAGGQQFDVAMIGMYEAPQFGSNGSLVDLTEQATSDSAYAIDDLIPSVRNGLSVDGKLYASPFYAESSFLMYRKDVLKKAGVTMPDEPTWDEVAQIAKQVNSPTWPASACAASPAGATSARRSRRSSTPSARTWWSAAADGGIDKAHGRPAAVPRGAPVLHRPRRERRREGRRERELQRVPVAVPRRQGRDVVRRHGRRRPARGRRQPGEGQERLRARAGQGDRGLGLAVVVGAGDPEEHPPSRTSRGSTSRGRPGPTTSRRPAARSRAAGRRSRRAPASRPTRSPSTRRPRPRSPIRRSRRCPRRRSTTRARPRARGCQGSSTSGVPEFQDVGNQCTQQFSALIAGRTSIDAALDNCQQVASAAGS